MSITPPGQSPAGAGDPADLLPRLPRKNLLLSATVEAGPLKAPVRIRNLSESGAMLDGAALPEPGTPLTLRRMEVEIGAVVVWRAAGRCGIRFTGAASVEEWVSGIKLPPEKAHQARVDAVQAAVRAGASLPGEAAPAVDPAIGATELERRIAEELLYVRRLIDVVGDGLTDDPIVLQRHTVALQNLDAASQILAHLGSILGSDDRRVAAEAVTMQDLRTRLLRKAIF